MAAEAKSTPAQIIPPGGGRTLTAQGVTLAFKAVSGTSDGTLTLIEYDAPAGFPGPPAHWHRHFLEGFYILEGEMQFEVDGETVDAPAGTFVLAPKGVRHTFLNRTGAPARFLVLMSPAGFEGYFDELIAAREVAPPGTPEFTERVRELGRKYDVQVD